MCRLVTDATSGTTLPIRHIAVLSNLFEKQTEGGIINAFLKKKQYINLSEKNVRMT